MVDIITKIGKDAGFAVTLTLSSVPPTRERSFAGTHALRIEAGCNGPRASS
jgi:hypothetical protein